jgi:hypothetical protein
MQEAQVPIELPTGWRATSDSRGVVIDSVDAEGRMQGSVTVCEQVRGFTLGVCSVRRPSGDSKYVGRGWQKKLYADAVSALQASWARHAALQHAI